MYICRAHPIVATLNLDLWPSFVQLINKSTTDQNRLVIVTDRKAESTSSGRDRKKEDENHPPTDEIQSCVDWTSMMLWTLELLGSNIFEPRPGP
jgi:hypothetical protein